MANKSKYIYFILMDNKPKTKVYDVVNKETGYILGQIKWFPNWRKYSFFPARETVFESDCLQYITNFLIELKSEHLRIRKIIKEGSQNANL